MKKYSYKELIKPIINIKSNRVSNREVKHLLRKFTNTTSKISEVWSSKYSDIENYQSYVYYICDKYINKHYIGVRFTPNKHSDVLLEDLKRYQTSSSNIKFKKLLKEDIESNKGRFTLHILKVFDNEIDAQNYEALCHKIFNVKNNKNFHNHFEEDFNELLIYSTKLWDLQEKREVYYKDIYQSVNYGSLSHFILHKKCGITADRYCLFIYKDIISEKYNKIHNYITLYKYDKSMNKILHITNKYKDWVSMLGTNFIKMMNNEQKVVIEYYKDLSVCKGYADKYREVSLYWVKGDTVVNKTQNIWNWINECGYDILKVINGKRISSLGYYLSYEACYRSYADYVVEFTLYTYKDDNLVSINKTLKEWLLFFNTDISTFNMYKSKGHAIQGYHFSESSCIVSYESELLRNNLYTLYIYDKDKREPVPIIKSHKEWKITIGYSYYSLFKGVIGSSKGFYTDIEVCRYENLEYSFINTQTNEYLRVNRRDGNKYISNFKKLITFEISMSKGWKLIPSPIH